MEYVKNVRPPENAAQWHLHMNTCSKTASHDIWTSFPQGEIARNYLDFHSQKTAVHLSSTCLIVITHIRFHEFIVTWRRHSQRTWKTSTHMHRVAVMLLAHTIHNNSSLWQQKWTLHPPHEHRFTMNGPRHNKEAPHTWPVPPLLPIPNCHWHHLFPLLSFLSWAKFKPCRLLEWWVMNPLFSKHFTQSTKCRLNYLGLRTK